MQVVLIILYIALGLAQITAYLAGIHLWLGVGSFLGLVIFFLTPGLPLGSIIDAAIAFYGAYKAWHWPLWQAALLTFPFALVGVVLMGAEGVVKLAATFKPRTHRSPTPIPAAETPSIAPIPPSASPRIGRRGICVVCGTIKDGSFSPCEECGFQPNSEQDLTIAIMLNEASIRDFEQVALNIKSGHRPIIRPEDVDARIESGREARRMLGRVNDRVATRIKTEGILKSTAAFVVSGVDKTLAAGTTEYFKNASSETIIAIVSLIAKQYIVERAPLSEKEFIRKFFAKRIMVECINSTGESFKSVHRFDFAAQVAQSIFAIDAAEIDLLSDKQSLEKEILPFIFRDKSGLLEYTVQFSDYPHIAGYIRAVSTPLEKGLQDLATKWNW